MMSALFEAASAIGTVGLSLGVTPELGTVSRIILIFLMYVGRVGGLTMIYAVTSGGISLLYQGYAEQRRTYLRKHRRVSEYDSENLMYSVIQEVLSEEAFSSIGCAVHVSLAALVKDYPLFNMLPPTLALLFSIASIT